MFSKMLTRCTDIFPKIYRHQFNQQLYDGTLSATTFRFFVTQDVMYLSDFSQALLTVSTQFKDTEYTSQFITLSAYVKSAELGMHRDYMQTSQSLRFFPQPELAKTKIPAIAQYTEHLLQTATTASVEEAVASLVPCFWIYSELGKQMNPEYCNEAHPYKQWIATYSDAEFISKTEALIQTMEKLTHSINCPEHQEKIIDSFEKSVNYELMFFDAAMSNYQQALQICGENEFVFVSGSRI